MAKPFAADLIMPPARLKPLLARSKAEPVQAAVGLTTDGEALMLLDRKAKPRAVLSMLRRQAEKAKVALNASSLRFGRAEVDADADPGTIRLTVNKEAPGLMRVRLTELARRIPLQKVEIGVDPALDAEPEEEEADQQAAPAADAAAPQTAEPQTAQPQTAQPQTAQPAPPPPPGPPPAAGPDQMIAAELQRLRARIPQAAGADAGRAAALDKVAAAIADRLAAGQAGDAARALAALRQALQVPPAAAPARDPAEGAAVRVAKGLLLWNGTRSHLEGQLRALSAAIVAGTKGEPDHAEIAANAGAVMAVMDRLDDRLSKRLEALRGTGDPARKRAITEEARQIVAEYRRYVAEDELLADIDENGFIPLDIKARLTTVLEAVAQAI